MVAADSPRPADSPGEPAADRALDTGHRDGAGALAAVLSLGDGAEAYARRRIEGEGLQVILVSPKTSDRLDGLNVPRNRVVHVSSDDAASLSVALGPATGVTWLRRGVLRWKAAPADPDRAAVVQGMEAHGAVPLVPMLAGRSLSAGDSASPDVAVVSESIARALAPDPGAAVGKVVFVESRSLRIVGVLPAQADADPPLVQVPAEMLTDLSVQGVPSAPVLVVRAERVETVEAVRASVEAWATPRFGDGVTVAATGVDRLREIARGFLVFKLLMGAFTAIALLVGGIGIMNVLLASVLERTREIGVRRALGARRRDIIRQFVAESVAIATAGSLIGLVSGVVGAVAATALMRAQTGASIYAAVTLQTVGASLLAAVVTGVVFGVYPALRASRLSPVDAIRTE